MGGSIDDKAELLCTVSGGYDSTAALLWSLEQGPTTGLFVDYQQPYVDREHAAVRAVVRHPRIAQHANWLGWEQVAVALPRQATAEQPWVPHRNLIIASLCCNVATWMQIPRIVFGSKSVEHRPDDPVSYVDSTLSFYRALEELVDLYSTQPGVHSLEFSLPLMGWSKRRVLEYLHREGIDLRLPWNCYSDGMLPCQQCAHCLETQPLVNAIRGAS